MTKIKGICRNEECELFNQPQEAEKSYFKCSKCGEPLIPFGNKTGGDPDKKKRIGIIAGAIVVVILIILGVVAGIRGCNGDEKPVAPVDTTEQKAAEDTAAAKADTVEAEVEPAPKASNMAAPSVEPTAQKPQTNQKSQTEPQTKTKDGYGTVNLGYGVYTGDLKNGKPHGHGTIRYTQSHKIVSSKDFVANPGDTYEGEFRDGSIASIGLWHHDGETTGVKP